MPSLEEMAPALQLLVSWLLYDRENETELRIAFAALVQERHHHFHDKEEYTETEFSMCEKDICVKALAILQEAKKPRIEVNELSAALLEKYVLRVQRADRKCIAFLEEKSLIEKPPTADGVTILEA